MSSSTQGNIFTRGLSRISRRKKKTKSVLVSQQQPSFDAAVVPMPIPDEKSTIFSKGMDRLRRSLRLPKKRRDRSHDRHLSPDVTGGSKTEQWQPDEGAVRGGTCCFNVKYLGSVEVYESRGMTVCEGALKSLKAQRRKPVKAVLYVSGDGLRVVDQGNSRGLLVDQTIEKVSFCAPDRQTDKGFAYICRDGASRRWMCHGFLATKETGERLSHAVGCAFSICLEKKKKRDEESSGTPAEATPRSSTAAAGPSTQANNDVFNPNWGDSTSGIEGPSSATTTPNAVASGASRANLAYQSFRKHVSIEDRYLDPQSVIINEVPASNHMDEIRRISKPRPSGNPALFQRQGSLRAPDMPTSADQFKRNLSLRPVAGAGGGVVGDRVVERKSCERAAYIDGRCEYYPSLAVPSSAFGATNDGFRDFSTSQNPPEAPVLSRLNSEVDESARTELRGLMMRSPGDHSLSPSSEAELRRLLMWQEFREAGVDVNTTQPGYGYGIEARIEPIPEGLARRSSCPTFGTQLYNEPIYEGDEDPLGLGIAPAASAAQPTPSFAKNGLDGLDLLYKGVPAPVVSTGLGGVHANGDFVSNWPMGNQQQQPQKPVVLGPLEKLQRQFEEVKLISTSSGESTPTARSKADEWLDDVLRVSMSMSPTMSPSTTISSPHSGAATPRYSTLPKSGPPPAHAPPPLPVRQAVSNGSPSIYQQNSARNSPAGINWNASPNPIQMNQIPAKPVDPFDVQWSRLAVNNTN